MNRTSSGQFDPAVPLVQDFGKAFDRRGLAEVVALHVAAAFRDQAPELILGFDAFGDDVDIESARQVDDRLDDSRPNPRPFDMEQ